jgi:chitinase
MSAAMKRSALILSLALFAGACRSALVGPQTPRYRIIAYVYGNADMDRIGADKLTHINYAFGSVNTNGEVVLDNPDTPAHLARLQALKAKNPRLKIILSVGGWGADNFSDAAFNNTSRQTFAATAITLIRRYALDGVDLDWEYPGQPGPGIKYSPDDKENFTLLLKTLRQGLDALSDERKRTGPDRYTLSIASAGGVYFEHTEMNRLHVYLDWINIMAYDFAGEWSRITSHHAGLYWSPAAGSDRGPSAADFVQQHLAAGIPSRKLVLGVPFYGRGWCGVDPKNEGLHQPFESYIASYPYSVLVRDYVGQRGFTRHWDSISHAPYLWDSSTGIVITYEDPDSLRDKARFIKDHHLGGVMYWEQSHDPDEILLGTLFYNLQ